MPPSRIVRNKPKIRLPRSFFLSAQCAHVTVTPDDSSSSVLTAGIPHACMGLNSGGRYGPGVGQWAVKSGHSSLFSGSPSHGTEYWRAYQRAPKNAAKNITSEKMNQLIAQRNERSTCLLNRPPSLSRITVPNQPNSMYTSVKKPMAKGIQPTL